MTTPDPRDLRDLAAAYVLGALDPEERAAFEARLQVDPTLQEAVRDQQELLGALADAAPPRRAPDRLRARVLEEAAGVRRLPTDPTARSAGPDPITPTPSSRLRAFLPWGVAAAAALAAVAFGWTNRGLVERADGLAARLERAEAAAESAATALAAREELLASFLGPDVRSATLASTGAPPSARVFFNAGSGSVVIAAFDLPPAPAGRIYQLWGIPAGGDPVSLGTFQTGPDGTAIVARSVTPGSEFAVSAVTEEPAGGSPAPTSTPFLVGSWSGDS